MKIKQAKKLLKQSGLIFYNDDLTAYSYCTWYWRSPPPKTGTTTYRENTIYQATKRINQWSKNSYV
jgi:hypothetical protein